MTTTHTTTLGTVSVSLAVQDLEPVTAADDSTSDPASFVAVDPDGNAILIDQHV
jgi:hypothetical protein